MSEDFNFGKTKIEVPNFDFKKIRKTLFIAVGLIILSGSFYTVNANDVEVISLFEASFKTVSDILISSLLTCIW